jgi:hypothetical protein
MDNSTRDSAPATHRAPRDEHAGGRSGYRTVFTTRAASIWRPI